MGRGPSIAGRKNAEDARRGKIFTKVIREISVAARISGDPNVNPRLRAAIDKGLSANMSKDVITSDQPLTMADGRPDSLRGLRSLAGYGPAASRINAIKFP